MSRSKKANPAGTAETQPVLTVAQLVSRGIRTNDDLTLLGAALFKDLFAECDGLPQETLNVVRQIASRMRDYPRGAGDTRWDRLEGLMRRLVAGEVTRAEATRELREFKKTT